MSHGGAMDQQQSMKEQLVGTRTVISWRPIKADGSTLQQYGANPAGVAFF